MEGRIVWLYGGDRAEMQRDQVLGLGGDPADMRRDQVPDQTKQQRDPVPGA